MEVLKSRQKINKFSEVITPAIEADDFNFDGKDIHYSSVALNNNPTKLPFNNEINQTFNNIFKKYDKLLKENYELNMEDYMIAKIVEKLKMRIRKNIVISLKENEVNINN